ncbi:hypothetical protein [Streptomyces sp. NPDC048002]|uniref:hypothetical protein n=1 Tax=Streptomyces sp. NPDC048002 TaxID=3154344 RepID=UPI0033D241EE
MTPRRLSIPDTPAPDTADLISRARGFRVRIAVLDREIQTALDTSRDRYGRTVDHRAEATARARRNQTALALYAAHLVPHADPLLDAARSTLATLPPARHTGAWRDLLDALAASHTEITGALERPAAEGTSAEREQHAAMWPHLVFWAEHGALAADLADPARLNQQPGSGLTAEERQMWTEMAQAAQQRRELDLIESWYAADGRLITLAYLVVDGTDTVVALAGDPDAPGWEVIGQFDNEYPASRALPRPVPPGVLRADAASRFNRPETAPEQPLHDLLQDIVEARGSSEVAEALLSATHMGYAAGPMVQLAQLLDTAAEFSHALNTVQGRQIGARLETLGRQFAFLAREVHDAAEDLGATVAVLPPHRTPKPPRIRSRPALDTTPPAPPARTASPARRL